MTCKTFEFTAFAETDLLDGTSPYATDRIDDFGSAGFKHGGFATLNRGPGDLAIPDGSHDGYPGGRTSSTEVHGTGDDDEIDHFMGGYGQNIYGFAGNDTITAGYADDKVFGGLGDDEIYANAGNDVVVGDVGDDLLFGQDGDDSIHAGDGMDSMSGGNGDDFIFLTDDGQTDTIYFVAGEDQDVIDNFELGIDKVALANFGISSFAELEGMITYSGDQAMIDFGGGDVLIFTDLDGPLGANDFLL
ncbi:MAG: hypothetical protein AAFW87_03400 [Pseudomonadota bacterium]